MWSLVSRFVVSSSPGAAVSSVKVHKTIYYVTVQACVTTTHSVIRMQVYMTRFALCSPEDAPWKMYRIHSICPNGSSRMCIISEMLIITVT